MYEMIERAINGKRWYGVVVSTPGGDAPCVWPYFIKVICKLGYYVGEARKQDKMIWINFPNQTAVVLFEDATASKELHALMQVLPLWSMAQEELRVMGVARSVTSKIFVSLKQNK
jgi:hypothetical protein